MTDVDKILLGYEMETGVAVEAKLHHLFISGVTQHSGKTTGLEAFIERAHLPALIFRTGRGELGFERAHRVLPYFRERTDWRFLEGLLSVHLREKTKIYRSNLMTVSRGANDLQTVWNRIRQKLTGRRKARGWDLKMFTELDQYFSEFMPSLGQVKFAKTLELQNGLNVVDLEGQNVALQQMVIAASLEYIMEKMSGVIVVVPEAYKLIPLDRPSPVRLAAEAITREGMKIKNFLWLDSQQLTGLDLDILRNVDIWLFGRQTLDREKERAAHMIPGKTVTADDVHGLTIGQFYVVQYGEKVQKIYVQPAWLSPETAVKVAKGETPAPNFSRDNIKEIETVAMAPDNAVGPEHYAPPPALLDGPPENAVQRMARENAQGILSGLDTTTRIVNLVVAQQKQIDDLRKETAGFAAYMGKQAKDYDEKLRALDGRISMVLGELSKTAKYLRESWTEDIRKAIANAPVQYDVKAPIRVEVNDPARIIDASETLEPLKVDTYSLRGQVAKLIEEGTFKGGQMFSAKGLREKLVSQFGSAAEKWDVETVEQELKDLSAPPWRLFIASNNAYRIRKRKS
jgi:hypothetical protein